MVKIEPHENGPLFVEMHYYLRYVRESRIGLKLVSIRLHDDRLLCCSAGKPDHLASWKGGGGGGRAAPHLPLLRGNGSHTVGGEKYRCRGRGRGCW